MNGLGCNQNNETRLETGADEDDNMNVKEDRSSIMNMMARCKHSNVKTR